MNSKSKINLEQSKSKIIIYEKNPKKKNKKNKKKPKRQNKHAQMGQMGGVQYIYVQDPITEIGNCTGVLIRQEPDLLEKFTGCEKSNRYHVFGQSPQGFKYLFKCKEKSECCMRNFCPSNLREFDMDIIHVVNPHQMYSNFSKSFANAYKPFKISICCLCRPEMILSLNDGNLKLGTIKQIWTICSPEFEIYDAKEQLRFLVTADCCQCGLKCANNWIGKSYEVLFDIVSLENGKVVGNIIKKVAEEAEYITDADSYQVNFPINSAPYDKLLLTSLALMIDYQYFEVTESNKSSRKKSRIIEWL